MYIWTKRQFVADLTRLVDGPGEPGAVLIGHTHNELAWCPSHGQPLSPDGYRDLFETIEPRIFGEARLVRRRRERRTARPVAARRGTRRSTATRR